MTTTVETIEDAIRTALSSDAALADRVRSFTVLPDLSEEEILRLIRNVPALAVISHEGRWEDGPTSVQDEYGSFSVLCVHRNLRSPAASLRGGASGEIGVYELVDDARRVLSRENVLGLDDVLSCRPVRRKLLRADGSACMYAVEVEVVWRRAI